MQYSDCLLCTKVFRMELFGPLEFRHLLGSLQYLTLTRQDLVYAVNHLYQFMSRPTHTHTH